MLPGTGMGTRRELPVLPGTSWVDSAPWFCCLGWDFSHQATWCAEVTFLVSNEAHSSSVSTLFRPRVRGNLSAGM